MAKVTKLPAAGPDDPNFSGPVIVSVPVARHRTPLPVDLKRQFKELRAQSVRPLTMRKNRPELRLVWVQPPRPSGMPPDVRVRFPAQIWNEALEQWGKRPRPPLYLVKPNARTIR